MDRFASMRAFAQVVEHGSFARAAQRVDTSTSSLSRQINDLEQHLGVRLLHRTTRRLSLTESGQSFYERCVQLLADLDEAESLASQSVAVPHGTLKITCPFNLIEPRISPVLLRFAAQWPRVRFDVSVSDRQVDLIEEGIDLAIRIGQPGGDRLVARRLGQTRLVPCAAPAWLARYGSPREPQDLANFPVLTYAYSPNVRLWRLLGADQSVHDVKVQGPLHANSGELLVAAAIGGMGAVFEPDFVVAPALKSGQLVRLLPDHAGPTLDIWAVYPSRRHLSAIVRQFVESIAEDFAHMGGKKPSGRGD